MNDILFYFVLGIFFRRGLSYSQEDPIHHILSCSILLAIFYFLTDRKREIPRDLLKEALGGVLGVYLEYSIVKGFSLFRNYYLSKVGALLLILGMSLATYSHYYFRREVMRSQVIMGGPYRYVRHPVYLGMFLYILGSLLYLGCFLSLSLLYLYFMVFLRNRIAAEEHFLSSRYEEYRKYRSKTSSGVLFLN